MSEIDFTDTVVVGIDVHKRSHKAVLVNCFGQLLSQYDVTNESHSIENFEREVKAKANNSRVIYALEDVYGNGAKLAQYLSLRGYDVYPVPSGLTERERRKTIQIDKSDLLDAKGVAKVILTASDTLPQLILSEKTAVATELKAIVDDRFGLVQQCTGIKNQLHELLHRIYGDHYEQEVRYKDLFCERALKQWKQKLEKNTDYVSRRILLKLKLYEALRAEVELLDEQLQEKLQTNEEMQLLKSIPGCGTTIAASVLAEIKDVERFSSSDKLAKYAGIAPRESSSSTKVKHYTNHRGNRKLNNVLFSLGLSQIGKHGSEVSKEYYKKKVAEGKSKMHALKCLRRRLVDIIFQILKKKESYDHLVKSS